jgi:TRAP-type uncharacterized transport system fused permease subunit
VHAWIENLSVKGRKGRVLQGYWALVVYLIGTAFSTFSMYYLAIEATHPWILRAGHLMFALSLLYMLTPASAKSPRDRFSWADAAVGVLNAATFIYIAVNIDEIALRAGVRPVMLDLVFGVGTVLLILEGARRFFGWALGEYRPIAPGGS